MKTVLITGSSTGIGYHAAHTLKQAGYRVFATARKPEDVVTLIAQGFESVQLDLASTDSGYADTWLYQYPRILIAKVAWRSTDSTGNLCR